MCFVFNTIVIVTKYEMKGVKKVGSPNSVIRGRAEVLRMRLGARAPGPGSLRSIISKPYVCKNNFVPIKKQTNNNLQFSCH